MSLSLNRSESLRLRGHPSRFPNVGTEAHEAVDTVTSSFPFSHSRSDSQYSLSQSRRPSIRRTNSIRSSKDIIPLQLKVDTQSAPTTTPGLSIDTSAKAPARSSSHRRGLSLNVGRADPARAATTVERKERPSSMFFGKLFSPSEEKKLNAGPLTKTFVDPNEHFLQYEREARSFDQSSDILSPRMSSGPMPLPALPKPCTCAVEFAKSQNRLKSRITDLETERETKDLTISMLSEQLLDKNQELELMRQRMATLEKALASSDGRFPLGSPAPSFECHFGQDEGLGTSLPALSTASRPGSSLESERQAPESSPRRKEISLTSINPDMSYEDLIEENVALKDEVSRLTNVLEDGLGALAELGL